MWVYWVSLPNSKMHHSNTNSLTSYASVVNMLMTLTAQSPEPQVMSSVIGHQ